MTSKGPGKSYRKGLSLVDAVEMFSDPVFTEQWFVEQRWPNGIECPRCDSQDIQHRTNRKPQPFRCNVCRMDFSVKTDTFMHSSKLPLKTWGLALYILTTGIKGTSSMKLHRDLGVTQKTAWHLGHRIRRALEQDKTFLVGTVEIDETYVGGKEKNKHSSKRLRAGRGTIGKAVVAGGKSRETGKVILEVVPDTTQQTLQGFAKAHIENGSLVYTDDHKSYVGIPFAHEIVKHGAREFVHGQAHTNGIESVWAVLKRGYIGVYHHMSEKHLGRYVSEFGGRHNDRPRDTLEQMGRMVAGGVKRRLKYATLIGAPATRQPKML